MEQDYTVHQGYLLKLYATKNRGSITNIANILGIERNYMYFLYGQETLEAKYLDALKKDGTIQIPGITTLEGNYPVIYNNNVTIRGDSELENEIRLLKEIIKAKDETIAVLRGNSGSRN